MCYNGIIDSYSYRGIVNYQEENLMSRLLCRNLKTLSKNKNIPKEVWNKSTIKMVDICSDNTFYQAVKDCRPIVTELNSVFEIHNLPVINTQKRSKSFEKEIRDFAKRCGISFRPSELITQLV